MESLRQARVIFRDLDYAYGEGLVLDKLANIHHSLCRFDDAIAVGVEASALHAEAGNRLGEASTLDVLARSLEGAGRPAEARAHRLRALGILEELGHPDAEVRQAQLAATDDPAGPEAAGP